MVTRKRRLQSDIAENSARFSFLSLCVSAASTFFHCVLRMRFDSGMSAQASDCVWERKRHREREEKRCKGNNECDTMVIIIIMSVKRYRETQTQSQSQCDTGGKFEIFAP